MFLRLRRDWEWGVVTGFQDLYIRGRVPYPQLRQSLCNRNHTLQYGVLITSHASLPLAIRCVPCCIVLAWPTLLLSNGWPNRPYVTSLCQSLTLPKLYVMVITFVGMSRFSCLYVPLVPRTFTSKQKKIPYCTIREHFT